MFVLDLCQRSTPTEVKTLQSLRWYMFTKMQCESKKLPPTPSALEFAKKWSHFITHVWKKSNVASPKYLPVEDYGWKYNPDSKTFDAVMTDKFPTPEAIIELSICKCKSGCKSQRCTCRRNNLVCTDIRMCSASVNIDGNILYSESEDEM